MSSWVLHGLTSKKTVRCLSDLSPEVDAQLQSPP